MIGRFFSPHRKGRGMSSLAPPRMTIEKVQSHQGINCYWHCIEDGLLYRVEHVPTQSLNELIARQGEDAQPTPDKPEASAGQPQKSDSGEGVG